TLQASLVARLDRLSSVKDVAQIGAAIGREFSYELVASVSGLATEDLDAALERLNAAGLITRRPDTGRRLRHHAQESTTAVACKHRQTPSGALPGDDRKPAGGRRPPFCRGRGRDRGDRLLEEGRADCHRSVGQSRGRQFFRECTERSE